MGAKEDTVALYTVCKHLRYAGIVLPTEIMLLFCPLNANQIWEQCQHV